MTTITKERIKLFIKNPLDNGLTRGEQMELARIALASLEAEPVLYQSCTRPTGIAVFRGRNGKNEVVSATKTICALQTRLTMPVGYTNAENYIPLRQRR
ncbi:hypothetical protein HZS97_07060 [Shigella flexneri]|uniref:hypothetical protein n=1 Tax=Shigella flexneri TaxID=623 RepID=UPI0025403957|nr:hypothetical protein [Shigella flexneri]UMU99469.1 hypothetical protein HZS97_07060 [Shigella flexneri]